ncbi:hypothetical protein [Niveispirillum irakense]|uniref:hypothetical protein n=1 Tax=Niveispirillum irakense TaxID=34011 RepID=UPI000414940C|nr:hypothetical protein [Niveispirillum irakense]
MAWLLLLAFGLRALLAPGIMPDFAADAGSLVTICTPQGERALSPDVGQGGHTTHAQAPCLFAAAGFANLGAVTAPTLSVPVEWVLSGLVWIIAADPAPFGPDRAHARGPPALSSPSSLQGSNV